MIVKSSLASTCVALASRASASLTTAGFSFLASIVLAIDFSASNLSPPSLLRKASSFASCAGDRVTFFFVAGRLPGRRAGLRATFFFVFFLLF